MVLPMQKKFSCVALVPARSGSKRIKDKNTTTIGGHPLLAYTIRAALDSGVFDRVVVSTDCEKIRDVARTYGAEVPFLRPKEYAGDKSPDIEFVKHTLETLRDEGYTPDCFSILRPTSPLRQPETIRRAWEHFIKDGTADSLRAVSKCAQHPAKMWKIEGTRMRPVLENPNKEETPWHSRQYADLPETYAQNASLEIAWTHVALEKGSIAGDEILPFVSEGYEGFDINYPEDVIVLEHLIERGEAKLPKVDDVK